MITFDNPTTKIKLGAIKASNSTKPRGQTKTLNPPSLSLTFLEDNAVVSVVVILLDSVIYHVLAHY